MARKKRFKQNDIARKAGLTPQGLSNILSGHRNASWPTCRRLEVATGISAVLWADGYVDRDYLTANYAPEKPRFANRPAKTEQRL